MGQSARAYVREAHDLNRNYQEFEISLKSIVQNRKRG
jgi:hypothetical protein